MNSPLSTRWLELVAIPLVALVIGIGVAVASSPSSLVRGLRATGTPVLPSPTPTPVSASPAPSVTAPGVLGKAPMLIAAGTQSLAGVTPGRAAASADGGKTWSTLVPPAGASGIALDPGNPQHGITGGSAIQFTVDDGATWKAVVAPPPAGGPFQVLEVSPFDGRVWYFLHRGKLLRTRDASATWRDIPGLPLLSNPVLAAGPVFGEFFLASGDRVFDLIDNGQQVTERPSLPNGVGVTALAAIGGGPASLVARDGDGALYVLEGTQWVAVSGAPGGPIAAGGNGAILAGDGTGKLGSPGSISFSVDDGATWHPAAGLPYDQSVEALAGQPDSTTFFAYCYGGDVYSSTDGGRDWTLLARALRSSAG
ncbi:hypothetical protein EPN29_02790 [bacterium]|nr:MAG: hypothetical protein EPN29_02790 [bacterium]